MQSLSARRPLRLPRDVVEDFWKHSWRSYSRALRRVVVGHPAVPDLQQLTRPCALMYGAQDENASRSQLAALLRRNLRSNYTEVPGTHHLPARQSERVADLLAPLLLSAGADRQDPAD